MENTLKLALIAVSAAGLFAACGGTDDTKTSAQSLTVKCAGINQCKGQGACAGTGHDCAGMNDCAGKGYVNVGTADECNQKGGTVI